MHSSLLCKMTTRVALSSPTVALSPTVLCRDQAKSSLLSQHQSRVTRCFKATKCESHIGKPTLLRKTATAQRCTRCSAATEDYVDVEGEVVDNRIPVTVGTTSNMRGTCTLHLQVLQIVLDHNMLSQVITGFLGSGKTTLLNSLLRQNHGRRIAVIENEVSCQSSKVHL